MQINLFTELAKAFARIKEKYISPGVHIRLKKYEDENYYIIKLIGHMKIPPVKIFKLTDLIMWYWVLYVSGARPKDSIFGREVQEKWKKEKEYIKAELNKYARKNLEITGATGPCHICGEPSYLTNSWSFVFKKENRIIEMNTRVCDKHRDKII